MCIDVDSNYDAQLCSYHPLSLLLFCIIFYSSVDYSMDLYPFQPLKNWAMEKR